jgi:capsular polysaccharide biosynthesis protein
MEEIDISQLLDYFKSKIVYIIFAMALAFAASAIYVYNFRVPEYTSYTTVLLTQSGESINANDLNMNNSLVSNYSEIIKSKRVLKQVISNLNLDYEFGQLQGKIVVGEVNDTDLIKISVTDADAELAADIANEIADVFSKEIPIIYGTQNTSIIDVAEVSKVASSASALKIILIVTLAGAFVAVGVVFVIFYFDTTIKNEEEIERLTGLPVIGIIPLSRERIKASQHRKFYDNVAKKNIKLEQKEVVKLDVEEIFTNNSQETIITEEIPVVEQELIQEVIEDVKKEEKVNTKYDTPHKVNASKKKTYYKRKTNTKK